MALRAGRAPQGRQLTAIVSHAWHPRATSGELVIVFAAQLGLLLVHTSGQLIER